MRTDPDKPITRIELEETAEGVFRKCWYAGWKTGQPADLNDFLPGRRMLALEMLADQRGWSVTQPTREKAILLKGEITRIDFSVAGGNVVIQRYPDGWTARTNPCQREVRRGVSLEDALGPYLAEGSGWTVRQWADGARAWKGQLLPVRDSFSILNLRHSYSQRPDELSRLSAGRGCLDFAYDL